MYTKPFCFFENGGRENRPVPEQHDVGCWFWFDLIEWQPPPPPSVDVSGRPTFGKYEFEEAVHCCSMYTFMSAVMNGLQPGPEEGKGQKRGVYAYRTVSSRKLAVSSSGYCVYDKISDDGIFFGVRLLLEVQSWREGEQGIGNVGMGHGQVCLQQGTFHLRSVVVHMLTLEDLQQPDICAHTKALYIVGGAAWNPDLEWSDRSRLPEP
jgi:hypothetical protein